MYERATWNAGLKKLITEEEYSRLSPDNKLYYRKKPEEDPRYLSPIDPEPFRLKEDPDRDKVDHSCIGCHLDDIVEPDAGDESESRPDGMTKADWLTGNESKNP